MDTEQMISQLLNFNIGTRSDIMNAMNNVEDKANVDAIMNYILDSHNNSEDDDDADFEEDDDMNDEWDYDLEYDDVELDETQQNDFFNQTSDDFMWRCHKCSTWYFQSEHEVCINCIPFKDLSVSYIKPGQFKFRPGYKSDIIVFGYIGNIKGRDLNIGIVAISNLCLKYLRYSTYDGWNYPVETFEIHGKDLCINNFNNRLQYRADYKMTEHITNNSMTDHMEWRTAFGIQVIHCDSTVVWTFEAVNNIKDMMVGILPSEDAVLANTTSSLSNISQIEGTIHQFSVSTGDVIMVKAVLKSECCSIEFLINDYEIKKSKFEKGTHKQFKLAVSLRKKYDAIEMVYCQILK